MVALVERMLALHEKLAAATLLPDKDEPSVRLYQRQIEATDRAIDALVAMRELRPTRVPEGKAGVG